jgi:hypothetical protein
MNLIEYANLANEILENSREYSDNKRMIFNLFKKDEELKLEIETVKLRLILIDSMYSTNMDKRLFGIKELADEILKLSQNSDRVLIDKINKFMQNPLEDEEIAYIFSKKFGMSKKGIENISAPSLISKYFYFLLDYQFPIYDSLVKQNLPIINKKIKTLDKLSLSNNLLKYFDMVIRFNKKSNINDFNKLDNMCWLFGKINRGSLYLVINRENYTKLIQNIDLTHQNSSDIDNEIKNYISNKMPKDIFSKDEEKFITWVYS